MKEKFDTTLYAEHDSYLSFKDLEKLDQWRDVLVAGDEDKLKEILYKHGADVRYGYQILSCHHRTATKPFEEYRGPLIRFKQRTDKYWLDKYTSPEDVARLHPSSFVRHGMRESLNMGVSINDCMEEALSIHAKLLKNMAEEDKLNKEKE